MVLSCQQPQARHTFQQWLALDRELGNWFADSLESIRRAGRTPLDAIANHGQTVAHHPGVGTLQLGAPEIIAARLGVTVISNFRNGDMACGGQGAPLVPGFHRILALGAGVHRGGCTIHNLGGISNLTYIHGRSPVKAWDTGPANLWIDAVVQSRTNGRLLMDRNGRLGLSGKAHGPTVARLLKHPYFKRTPPKSTGRDDFSSAQVLAAVRHLELRDAVATVTEATAKSISSDYHRNILSPGLPLSRIIFCGGGALNPALILHLEAALDEVGSQARILNSSHLGIPAQDMEAAAFAFLGRESLLGHALGGSWTGASGFGPPGHLIPGRNWSALLRKVRRLTSAGHSKS